MNSFLKSCKLKSLGTICLDYFKTLKIFVHNTGGSNAVCKQIKNYICQITLLLHSAGSAVGKLGLKGCDVHGIKYLQGSCSVFTNTIYQIPH